MKILFFKAIILCVFFITSELFSDDWQRVYLASFPRSGNHWMRYLIEEVTHIATASVYPDHDHPVHLSLPWGYSPSNGYEGNSRYPSSDDILVIKTHYPFLPEVENDQKNHIGVVRIVRNPIDSLYSFFGYYKEYTHDNANLGDVLGWFINSWKNYQLFWNNQKNVTTLRYEDFLVNPKDSLRQLLLAIGYGFTEEDIERAVNKYPPIDYEYKHLHHYTNQQIGLVRKSLRDLLIQFNYQIPRIPIPIHFN